MPSIRRSFIAAFAFSALALAAPLSAETPQPAKAEWGRFGIQTRWIDTATRPGDDFNRYVSGKWEDAVQIPPDKTRIGAFMSLRDLSEDRLHAILERLVAGQPAPGSAEARVADAYKAFMGVAAINAAGLAPARPVLDRIAAAKTTEDLLALFAMPGIASPIGAGVDADEKQSDRYALYMGQSGLGLPDRDYYLADTPKFRDIRAKYVDYLALLLRAPFIVVVFVAALAAALVRLF